MHLSTAGRFLTMNSFSGSLRKNGNSFFWNSSNSPPTPPLPGLIIRSEPLEPNSFSFELKYSSSLLSSSSSSSESPCIGKNVSGDNGAKPDWIVDDFLFVCKTCLLLIDWLCEEVQQQHEHIKIMQSATWKLFLRTRWLCFILLPLTLVIVKMNKNSSFVSLGFAFSIYF